MAIFVPFLTALNQCTAQVMLPSVSLALRMSPPMCFTLKLRVGGVEGVALNYIPVKVKMASRERRRLLPTLLPLLPVDNRVLLPGSSMVVHVNDPRG